MAISPALLLRVSGRRLACTAKLFLGIVLALVCIACGSKPVAKVPPPPPPLLAPGASIEAVPSTLRPGQSAVLTWKTENATEVTLEPLGKVEARGSKNVTPSDSTTYRVIAKGLGGQQEASVRVTVLPPGATALPSEDELFAGSGSRQDVYFDLDEYAVRSDQQSTVANDAAFLKKHGELRILIEGHCDELGSIEYNLALGESRAQNVKSLLVKAGVSPTRIATISYGKERPFCLQQSEDCYRQNRRAHIVPVSEP